MYNNFPPQNNNYYQQYQRYQQPQPIEYAPPQIKGRPVLSIEEARAAQIDFDGSIHVFTDIGNKRIYTKQFNPDGTASLRVYSLVESDFPPTNDYVTRQEFEQVIAEIRGLASKGADKIPPAAPAQPTNIF